MQRPLRKLGGRGTDISATSDITAQKSYTKIQLVEGPQIIKDSPRPTCIACTEAKLSDAPYGPASKRRTKPGDLTHQDLWGHTTSPRYMAISTIS